MKLRKKKTPEKERPSILTEKEWARVKIVLEEVKEKMKLTEEEQVRFDNDHYYRSEIVDKFQKEKEEKWIEEYLREKPIDITKLKLYIKSLALSIQQYEISKLESEGKHKEAYKVLTDKNYITNMIKKLDDKYGINDIMDEYII